MGGKFSRHRRRRPRLNKAQIPWLFRGAIRSNNIETLQYLLSHPHMVDPSMIIEGYSPLNLAIELGNLQMVKMLIKAGEYRKCFQKNGTKKLAKYDLILTIMISI